ncbi:MAG: DUF4331 family protein [Rhizobacter sp.]|nr:DUF4331 family protein [Chlorobiales bacterium]
MKTLHKLGLALLLSAGLTATGLSLSQPTYLDASSHREAPLISADPLADNCDLYAFRSPDDTNTVTIVATYIPLELPEGGPNYATFGENINYEIHIKNQTSTAALGSATDNITYRFTFTQTNEDPTTFFNIRLGAQNLKTSYTCSKSVNGGGFTALFNDGIVPPNNIGPRSIGTSVGINQTYDALVNSAVKSIGEGTFFCGPRDDPFFVDLGGVFDLGQTRKAFGTDAANPANARDAVAGYNTHAIVIKIPISTLQKDGKNTTQAAGILDRDFVIGVWASASRPQVTTLSTNGDKPTVSGNYVQVSRLGMPLTNEVIIPVGQKDKWNAYTPYSAEEQTFATYFANPELALYMDSSQYAAAIPGLDPLIVQSQSYPAIGVIPGYTTPGFDFRNTKDGAFAVLALAPDLTGTAFAVPTAPAIGGLNTALVGAGQPRRVDILPIFYFGVPNLIPYQLATGKTGGPLSAGKPFVETFLPITSDAGKLYGGDMLRLNMATPVTPRGTEDYNTNARFGLIQAAVNGLLAAPYNTTTNIEFIPHMDGFPNGRRLEDDVTTIELQAVGGLVLAAVGLPFNDAVSGAYADLASAKLVGELTYNAGPTKNDLALPGAFPYLATPHRGYDYVKQLTSVAPPLLAAAGGSVVGGSAPKAFVLEQNYPNPFNPETTIKYQVAATSNIKMRIYNSLGQVVTTLVDKNHAPGVYTVNWNAQKSASGMYFYRLEVNGVAQPARKALLVK